MFFRNHAANWTVIPSQNKYQLCGVCPRFSGKLCISALEDESALISLLTTPQEVFWVRSGYRPAKIT